MADYHHERGEGVVQPPIIRGGVTKPRPCPILRCLGNPRLVTTAWESGIVASSRRPELRRLNQGQTVAELAKTMPQQTVSEAVHQIVGNVPHSLEITNAIDRTAGDDVLKLHEGAIRELAKALSDIFTKADAAAAGMGVPYDKGGLQAAEQAYGPNSPVVHAIRTADLENQMESAGIVREFLRPILSGLTVK